MSAPALTRYAAALAALAGAPSTREETYYPAVKTLLEELLAELNLPFVVRTGTGEARPEGGADLPDLALYDSAAEFPVVCGDVKLPQRDLHELARSTDGNDQVGRYLARTRVVVLCNLRGFLLLTVDPGHRAPGPVPPAARHVEQVAELWPSAAALAQGRLPLETAHADLLELRRSGASRAPSAATHRAPGWHAGAPGVWGTPSPSLCLRRAK